jgi:hypothetical protein
MGTFQNVNFEIPGVLKAANGYNKNFTLQLLKKILVGIKSDMALFLSENCSLVLKMYMFCMFECQF